MLFRISIVDSHNGEVIQKQIINIGYPTHAANFKKSSFLPISVNETATEERDDRYRSKIEKEEQQFSSQAEAFKANCATVVKHLHLKGRKVFEGVDETKYRGITGLLYLKENRSLDDEAWDYWQSLATTCILKLTAKELTLLSDGRINEKLKRPSDSRLKRLKRRLNNLQLKDIDKAISHYKVVVETSGCQQIFETGDAKGYGNDDSGVKRKRYKSCIRRRKTENSEDEEWKTLEQTYITDIEDVFQVDHNAPREKLFLLERWTSIGDENQWCNVRRIIVCILLKLTHRPNTKYHNQISISVPCLDTYDLVLNGNRIFHPHIEMNKIYPHIHGSRFKPIETTRKAQRTQLVAIAEESKELTCGLSDSQGEDMEPASASAEKYQSPVLGKRRKRRKTIFPMADDGLPSICEEDYRSLDI